ncbi:MAG: hypothetical protein Q9172_007118 [Xanthocarpia lactea]
MTSKCLFTLIRPFRNHPRSLTASHPYHARPHLPSLGRSRCPVGIAPRLYATKSTADEMIEEITEMYATAKDEFEIASEETDKKSVYAADDRQAAREELDKLKEAFEHAVRDENGEEVRRRVGNRIRELEQGVVAMEERAMED